MADLVTFYDVILSTAKSKMDDLIYRVTSLNYFLCFSTDDPCSPDPCLNSATCSADSISLGFKCSCSSGYIGLNCGIQEGDTNFSIVQFRIRLDRWLKALRTRLYRVNLDLK